MPNVRFWFFTHNLPDGVDFDPDGPAWFQNKHITYLKAQVEVAPTTGKCHWQGVFDLDKGQKHAWPSNNLDSKAHFEATRNRAKASTYVFKDETAYEPPIRVVFGVPVEEEKPMQTAIAMVKKGKTNLEIAEVVPAALVQWSRGLGILRGLWAKERRFQTELYILWGNTGCGKSHWAHKYAEAGGRMYEKDAEAKYWDRYDSHDTVVIEEFDKYPLPLGRILRLADKYPVTVEPKGFTEVQFVAKKIFLTASTHPSGWYNQANAWPQLERRITRMQNMVTPWEEGMEDEEGPWPELLPVELDDRSYAPSTRPGSAGTSRVTHAPSVLDEAAKNGAMEMLDELLS